MNTQTITQDAQLFQLLENVKASHKHMSQVISLLTMPTAAQMDAKVGIDKILQRAEQAHTSGDLETLSDCYLRMAKYQMPESVNMAYQQRMEKHMHVDHNHI